MSTNKIKAIFDAKKREGESREFTYRSVAEKMNEQFQQAGVKESVFFVPKLCLGMPVGQALLDNTAV